MAKDKNSLDIYVNAHLNAKEFREEVKKLNSVDVPISWDKTELENLRKDLANGLSTTVKINVDDSQLKSVTSEFNIDHNIDALNIDDFIDKNTKTEFQKTINDFKSHYENIKTIKKEINSGISQMNLGEGSYEDLAPSLKAYREEFEKIIPIIGKLQTSGQFNKIDFGAMGFDEKSINQIKKYFSSIGTVTSTYNKEFTNIESKIYDDLFDEQVESFDKISEPKDSLTEYIKLADTLNSEISSIISKSDTENFTPSELNVEQLSKVSSLMEGIQKINTIISSNPKYSNQSGIVQVTSDYETYRQKLEEVYAEHQKLRGVLSSEPISNTQSESAVESDSIQYVEPTQESLDKLKTQIEEKLGTVSIGSFSINQDSISDLKNEIQTALAGTKLRFEIDKETLESELSTISINKLDVSDESITSVRNKIQSQLSNLEMNISAVNVDQGGRINSIISAAKEKYKSLYGDDNYSDVFIQRLETAKNKLSQSASETLIRGFGDAISQVTDKNQLRDVLNATRNVGASIGSEVYSENQALKAFSDAIGNKVNGDYSNVQLGVVKVGKFEASTAIANLVEDINSALSTIDLSDKFTNGISSLKIENFNAQTAIEKLVSDINNALNGNINLPVVNPEAVGTTNGSGRRLSSYEQLSNRIRREINRITSEQNKLNKLSATAFIDTDNQSLSQDYATQVENLRNLMNSLDDNMDSSGLATANEQFNKLLDQAQQLKMRFEEVRNSSNFSRNLERSNNKAISLSRRIDNLVSKLNQYHASNSKAFKDAENETEYQNIMSILNSGNNLNEEDVNNISKRFDALKRKIVETGKTGKTTGETIKAMYEKFGGWTLVTRTLTKIIQLFKSVYNSVREVDTAMTNLKKVSSASTQELDSYLNRIGSKAHEVGSSMSDLISATADFSRLGYDLESAQKLGEAATIYKSVAEDLDIETASQSIISTMQAFKDSKVTAEEIVDLFNHIGNNFAISSAGIGDALQRSAASLNAANNSLTESIALVTAANTVVQNPDTVGTAMKTISARIRGAKTELEALGEDTDFLSSGTSKYREEIKKLSGVDIMLDENNFKSTYKIFKELSAVYSQMKDTSQARIAELLGGKNNANVVSALLNDFSVAENVVAESGSANGSAQKELEKSLDSIDGKLNQLSATWQDFSTNVLDSSLIKGGIDFLDGLLSKLNSFSDVVGGIIPLITTIVGIYQGAKGNNFWDLGVDEPTNHWVLIMCPQFVSYSYNRTFKV